MRRIQARILILLLLCFLPQTSPAVKVTGTGKFEIPTWFADSFLDLRDDVKAATNKGKRVMIYFHQDGCPYCAQLVNTNFSQKPIVDYMKQHIYPLEINMWGDREVTDMSGNSFSEKNFAQSLKVWFTPTLLFFDERGKVIMRINGYYPPHRFMAALQYVGEKQENKTTFRDYYAKKAPLKAKGTLHDEQFFIDPPYRLDKLKGKPVAVFFEQKDCPSCDTLHKNIFTRPATMEQLQRFHVLQLDMWSDTPVTTVDSKSTTARKWASDLGISYAPSAVFFDVQGKEVIRIEAFLKAFHVQSVMDYAASGAYKRQPSLQRFLQERAQKLLDQGIEVDLWK